MEVLRDGNGWVVRGDAGEVEVFRALLGRALFQDIPREIQGPTMAYGEALLARFDREVPREASGPRRGPA